jgi:hypothetical protein
MSDFYRRVNPRTGVNPPFHYNPEIMVREKPNGLSVLYHAIVKLIQKLRSRYN